jgi:hypothetical protein
VRPESRPILSCSRNSAHPQLLKQIANALNVKLRERLQVTALTNQLTPDYANLPAGDFSAHERAIAEARRLRDEASPERKIAKMTNRELDEYVRDCDDAARESKQRSGK